MGGQGGFHFIDCTYIHTLPNTLLGGAPHPPDPPGLEIHEKLNFQKISRPYFFIPGAPGDNLINTWGPRGPIKNTSKNIVNLYYINPN